jgi:hypothetical protein
MGQVEDGTIRAMLGRWYDTVQASPSASARGSPVRWAAYSYRRDLQALWTGRAYPHDGFRDCFSGGRSLPIYLADVLESKVVREMFRAISLFRRPKSEIRSPANGLKKMGKKYLKNRENQRLARSRKAQIFVFGFPLASPETWTGKCSGQTRSSR